MTKTLKQTLTGLRIYGIKPNDVIEIDLAIELFKEWLTQKRQEISNEIKILCRTSPTEATTQKITFLSANANQIDELLEEL